MISETKMQLCYLTYKKVKIESLCLKRLHYSIIQKEMKQQQQLQFGSKQTHTWNPTTHHVTSQKHHETKADTQ